MTAITTKQADFFASEDGLRARQSLQHMVESSRFVTKSSYSANSAAHPDNMISFVDKHMQYLSLHRDLKPEQYIANLKLMTRLR